MFETDDYDQVLSQIDFPELCVKNPNSKELQNKNDISKKNYTKQTVLKSKPVSADFQQSGRSCGTCIENSNKVNQNVLCDVFKNTKQKSSMSPTHTKRKIINTYFDHKSKRKFPGPAGLLSGNFEDKKDDGVCHMELLSQDIDFTQSYLQGDVFDTPIWKRLVEDTASLKEINSIKAIKHQALVGNLRRRKAQFVLAFVESVDRSAIDPLITLRDKTGNIKCTLHRDAWTAFSTYIVSEYCALVLCKPTVLTTGSAFKKHYLNITLSNIFIIYSSSIVSDSETFPDGYQKIWEENYSIIKIEGLENISTNDSAADNISYLGDLDNIFSDDLF